MKISVKIFLLHITDELIIVWIVVENDFQKMKIVKYLIICIVLTKLKIK